jgi:K+/H+ antiporter YhaU regulatory subunit KhtT
LIALVAVSRSRWVDRRSTRVIARLLARFTDVSTRDLGGLLKLSGEYTVSELAVSPGDWLADRSLGDLALRDEGAVVLGVTRKDGRYLGAPRAATTVHAGDVLVVYGRGGHVGELDDRPAGPDGQRAHRHAVTQQRQAEHEQRAADARPA